ncbi:NB-ARC domain-containing protein [Frankia nepalensis]|uniref:NB-ARC domain-containing protein n=1 Tax=Frankia nepalensis TaxID=1836974 RepID=UPI0027DE3052|nr:NB-ARC domain-containing protein [Frankia nepalensis]
MDPELEAIRALLTPEEGAAVVGLTGIAGVGKSALARALVHDAAVAAAFLDGIVWVTAGQTRDPRELLAEVLAAFGDTETVASVAEGARRLLDLLEGTRCLLVLDDVWSADALHAVVTGGSALTVLFTTRVKTLALDAGYTYFGMGRLPAEPARVVLSSHAGCLAADLPPEADRLLARCSGWPLALAAAGAAVRRGHRWADVAQEFEEENPLVPTVFDDYSYTSLWEALAPSLAWLSEDQARRFGELATFEGCTQVPAEVVVRLWGLTSGMDLSSARDLLATFEQMSLLWHRGMGEQVGFHSLVLSLIGGPPGESGRSYENHRKARVETLNGRLAADFLDRWGGLPELPHLPAPAEDAPDPADRYRLEEVVRHLGKARRPHEAMQVLTAYRARFGEENPLTRRAAAQFSAAAGGTAARDAFDPDARVVAIRRRLLAADWERDAAAVRDDLAQVVAGLEGDRRDRLVAEFGFLLDDELRDVVWAEPQRRRWILGVWAALATGNDFSLDSTAIPVAATGVSSPPGERVAPERTPSVGDSEPRDGREGDSVEERLLALLQLVFTMVPAEGEAVLNLLRRQDAGTPQWHDARFDSVAAGRLHRRWATCHAEISDVPGPLTLRDVAGRLAESEEGAAGAGVDQFVILAPRADPTDELRARVRRWNEGHSYPFEVQIWSPENGLRELFALDPAVYEAIYGEPYPGPTPSRAEVVGRWRALLRKPVRFPAAWRGYLVDDALHCISGEDRARFRELLGDFVEPEAADENGIRLGCPLETEVRAWLRDGSREAGSLLLLAEFGEGKSFFTYLLSRRLSAEALREPDIGWIPLRLALKDLRNVRDGRELLERRLAEIGATVAEWWALCDRYRTLVILDGFDEMSVRLDPASLRDNINKLADCHELFSRSKLLITSRTQFFERQRDQQRFLDRVGGPRILRLAHAARGQVLEHLSSYARKVDAEKKLSRLANLYDPIGLARKPLFLDMIKEALPELPDDHFDELVLYRTYVERSIRRKIEFLADDQAEVTRTETIDNLQAILEEIATHLYLEERTYIELRSLRLPDGGLAEKLWRMSDGTVAPVDTDAADDARARIGIRSLLKPVHGVDQDCWPVDFFHRSMREYFFARAVLRALRQGDARRMLALAPLQPEVTDFLKLMIGDLPEPDRDRVLAHLLGLARGAVRGGNPGSLGGNAISLLHAVRLDLPRADWSGLDLDYAYLAGANLRGMDFRGSSLRYANLDNADLRDVDLRDADLTGVRLEETARVLTLSRTAEGETDGSGAVYAFYSDNKLRRWRLVLKSRLDVDSFARELPNDIQGVAVGPTGELVVLAAAGLEIHLPVHDRLLLASRFRPRMDLRSLRDAGADLLLSLERPAGPHVLRYDPVGRSIVLALASKGVGCGALVDGDTTAVVPWGDGRLALVRRVNGGSAQHVTLLPTERVTSFDVLPVQGTRPSLITTGHADGTVALWRISTQPGGDLLEAVWSERPHQAAVTAVLFCGDRYLVTAGADRTMTLFGLSGRAALVGSRPLALTLQCAGARIDGVTGERERRILAAALAKTVS